MAAPHRQDFSSDRPGDISAFLCNILEANNVKPKRVLRASTLPTHDLQDGDALNALFQAALPFMPETVASDSTGIVFLIFSLFTFFFVFAVSNVEG